MENNTKVSVNDIRAAKGKRKLTMLTAYDYPTAALVDKAGIDMVLVGDSLANVVLGLKSTTEVGMAEMIHHAKAVTRAVTRAMVIGDMPFDSYQVKPEDCVKNARRFIDEAKCDAVKLEWFDRCLEVTEKIVKAGIPVVGHIGLTPQTADKLGGFKVQGKDAEAAKRLIKQAQDLTRIGCFSIVLECVPDQIAKMITEKIKIPTIGIGAGKYTDGQVLVIHDAIGLFERYTPKFVKKYINLSPMILEALQQYKKEVEAGMYPGPEHSFSIKEDELKKIENVRG
ncbi:MAG TPA: 3-methyl-2-oxobutanoate hydroxymethyltransferase [Candidatus Omnitrophota bacterium]|nr:3-methyl-2-oxobutanoate hydroxymethyltransferase [Candidatus Omnitrophota bacterium]MDD4940595.1 3-methyl-2-oxobutanoate hydroxymethyltransferase [Candidatus Omnitrophota bacterium]HNQ50109.1 3-methyl-2-oxobutanoate hydroxymethyltransferase [Candidatus Omnitrophota bacterium]